MGDSDRSLQRLAAFGLVCRAAKALMMLAVPNIRPYTVT